MRRRPCWIHPKLSPVCSRSRLRPPGSDDPLAAVQVASKRIYLIDITNATDVSSLSLANTSALPAGVQPVTKTLFVDMLAELQAKVCMFAACFLAAPYNCRAVAVGPTYARYQHVCCMLPRCTL